MHHLPPQASPSSSTDDPETKLAGLEKKRERLINRTKLSKEFGRDVDPILTGSDWTDWCGDGWSAWSNSQQVIQCHFLESRTLLI
jgi:hypothetical protein